MKDKINIEEVEEMSSTSGEEESIVENQGLLYEVQEATLEYPELEVETMGESPDWGKGTQAEKAMCEVYSSATLSEEERNKLEEAQSSDDTIAPSFTEFVTVEQRRHAKFCKRQRAIQRKKKWKNRRKSIAKCNTEERLSPTVEETFEPLVEN